LQILNSYDTAPPFFIGDNGIAPKYGRFYSHHHYIVTANTPGNQVKSWALRRAPGTVAGKTTSDLRESPAEKEIPHLLRHNWPLNHGICRTRLFFSITLP